MYYMVDAKLRKLQTDRGAGIGGQTAKQARIRIGQTDGDKRTRR